MTSPTVIYEYYMKTLNYAYNGELMLRIEEKPIGSRRCSQI